MTRYRLGKHEKSRRRRVIFWLIIGLVLVTLIGLGAFWIRQALRPQVVIKQAKAVTTTVSYNTQNKLYNEPDFSISLPSSWHVVPRPAGPYQSYTWQSSDVGTNGQLIEILENTIPVNFAVNRVLIVEGEVDHLALEGQASDNCSTFTKNAPAPNETGAPAEWDGVSFLCDQRNQERDVIGTSSTDGVNTVILKDQQTGVNHKFFFIYTDFSVDPDYTVFYNTLNSFRMN
jgi:hypothetical protein